MKKLYYLYTSNFKAKKPICNATQIMQKILNPMGNQLKQKSSNKQSNSKSILKFGTNDCLHKKLENSIINNLSDNFEINRKADLLEVKESHADHVRVFQTNSILEQQLISRTIPNSRCSQYKNVKGMLNISKEKYVKERQELKKDIHSNSRNPNLEIKRNCLLNSFQNQDAKRKEQYNNINQLCGSFSNLTTMNNNFDISKVKINKSIFNYVNDNSIEINHPNIHQKNDNLQLVTKVSFFKGTIQNNFESEYDNIVKACNIFKYYIKFEEFKQILFELRFIENSNIMDNRLSQDLWNLISLGSETSNIIHLKEILKVIIGISEDKFKPVLGSENFPLSIYLDFKSIEAKQCLFDSKNKLLISKKQYKLIQKYFKSFILKRMFGKKEPREDIIHTSMNEINLNLINSNKSKSRIPILNKSTSEDRLNKLSLINNFANITQLDCIISENPKQGKGINFKYKEINDQRFFKNTHNSEHKIPESTKTNRTLLKIEPENKIKLSKKATIKQSKTNSQVNQKTNKNLKNGCLTSNSNHTNQLSKNEIDLKSLISIISKRNSKENINDRQNQMNKESKPISFWQNLSENSSFDSENESTEINEIPIKHIPESFIEKLK